MDNFAFVIPHSINHLHPFHTFQCDNRPKAGSRIAQSNTVVYIVCSQACDASSRPEIAIVASLLYIEGRLPRLQLLFKLTESRRHNAGSDGHTDGRADGRADECGFGPVQLDPDELHREVRQWGERPSWPSHGRRGALLRSSKHHALQRGSKLMTISIDSACRSSSRHRT